MTKAEIKRLKSIERKYNTLLNFIKTEHPIMVLGLWAELRNKK